MTSLVPGRAPGRAGPSAAPAPSRCTVLRAGAAGSAVACMTAAACSAVPSSRAARGGARTIGSYDFNQGWLFGGGYVEGSEAPSYDDRDFAEVTIPHTVTALSWAGWDPASLEKVWIYRKHFRGAGRRRGRALPPAGQHLPRRHAPHRPPGVPG